MNLTLLASFSSSSFPSLSLSLSVSRDYKFCLNRTRCYFTPFPCTPLIKSHETSTKWWYTLTPDGRHWHSHDLSTIEWVSKRKVRTFTRNQLTSFVLLLFWSSTLTFVPVKEWHESTAAPFLSSERNSFSFFQNIDCVPLLCTFMFTYSLYLGSPSPIIFGKSPEGRWWNRKRG